MIKSMSFSADRDRLYHLKSLTSRAEHPIQPFSAPLRGTVPAAEIYAFRPCPMLSFF